MNEPQALGILREAFQHLALSNRDAALEVLDRAHTIYPAGALLNHAERLVTRKPDANDNSALAHILRGWNAYYEAHYAQAGDHFLKAWTHASATREPWASWAALGAGKVASDLGCWAPARNWLLASLMLARRQQDLDRLAEAHGALAEVLLRAGYPREAFEYFTVDQRLLPVGSNASNRLKNYRAICLSHMGYASLAEPILWASFHAEWEPNPEGAWYALGSLHAMALREQDDALLNRLEKLKDRPRTEPPGMVAGFIALAFADRERRQGDLATAGTLLERAKEAFATKYPVEILWVRGLAASLGGEPVPAEEWHALQSRQPPLPPDNLPCSLLDEHARDLPLATDRPFADLAEARGEAAWNLANRFFV